MTLTRITSDGITDGTITATDLATNIDLVDNQKLRLGTGNDLELYHSGSNAFFTNNTGFFRIANTTGGLFLDGNDVTIRSEAGDENFAIFNNDGAVELFHNNAKKFETTSYGSLVTGRLNTTGNISMPDNAQIHLGDSIDLAIYHNATDSFVDNSTGDLYFRNTSTNGDCVIQAAVGGHVYIRPNAGENGVIANTNGAVELYYDNSKKFETTTSGVSVTGGVNATGLSTFSASGSAVRLNDGSIQRYGNADADYFQYYDGSGDIAYLSVGTSRTLRITTDDFRVFGANNTEQIIRGQKDGAVELYHNNTKRFETQSGGAAVTGGLNVSGNIALPDSSIFIAGTGDDLQIYHDGSHSYLDNTGTGDLKIRSTQANGDVNIVCSDSNGGFTVKTTTNENMINSVANGAVELYYNHVERITTKDNGAKITGSLEIEGGTVQGNHDATLYVTADNNNDWGLIVDYGTGSSGKSEYGAKIVSRTGSTHAFSIAQVSGGSHAEAFLINGDGHVVKTGNITPRGNNAFDLGSSSLRWRDIYTNDLNLSNEGGSNDVDGTWGSYTIQEGAEDLFLVNKRNGKKYKFNLTEVS